MMTEGQAARADHLALVAAPILAVLMQRQGTGNSSDISDAIALASALIEAAEGFVQAGNA